MTVCLHFSVCCLDWCCRQSRLDLGLGSVGVLDSTGPVNRVG